MDKVRPLAPYLIKKLGLLFVEEFSCSYFQVCSEMSAEFIKVSSTDELTDHARNACSLLGNLFAASRQATPPLPDVVESALASLMKQWNGGRGEWLL